MIPHLLIRIGGLTGVAPPKTKKIGWDPAWRLRHDPEELERRIKAQRSDTFGPRWFENFLAAHQAALDRAEKAKSEKEAAKLRQAAEAVEDAIFAGVPDVDRAVNALKAAAGATRVTAAIKQAELAIEIALADDDEEAIMLLLN